jgi:hypothetical protein
MPESSDDLSKYVINTEVTPEKVQRIANGLAAGEKSDGAIFQPMEAVAAGIRTGNMMAEFMKIFALMLARGIIMPMELILRHTFGERYFNAFVFVGFLIAYCAAYYGFGVSPTYCHFVFWVTILLVAGNRALCFWRDRKGLYWHSYFEGESWWRIPVLDKWLAKYNFTIDASKLVFEPLIVFVISLFGYLTPDQHVESMFRSYSFNPVAWYFQIVAVVMFLYQLYCHLYRREQYLNEKDAEIEAEVRGILSTPDKEPGLETHRGLAYVIMGGKQKAEPKKDCPNPDI